MSISKTKAQFILDAKKIHQDRYLYDKVIYVNAYTKIIITCKIHGDFIITPDCFLNSKQICQKCKKEEILLRNKNSFLKKAKNKYGNTFCYSLLDYKSYKKKVKIICPQHGLFEISPEKHLRSKYGCFQCTKKMFKNIIKNRHLNNRKKFYKKHIQKAKNKYGKKFDYTKIDYTKTLEQKNNIICPAHGIQKINFEKHRTRLKFGCAKCGISYLGKLSKKYNHKTFIKKCKEVWGNKIDYSLTKFLNTNNKTFFTCKEHSHTFQQLPISFLNKKIGCKYCHKKKYIRGTIFVKNKKAFIYLFEINNLYDIKVNQLNMIFDTKAIKFGMTHNIKKREKRMKRKLNGSLKLIALYQAKDDIISEAESDIKKIMKKEMSYLNKNIMKDGYSETVSYTNENLNKLLEYCENNDKLNKCNLKKKQTLEIF